METNSEAGGTPDDVAAAAGAARRVVTPAWLTVLTAVLIAAIYAGFVVIAWGETTDIVSGADCRSPALNDLIQTRSGASAASLATDITTRCTYRRSPLEYP